MNKKIRNLLFLGRYHKPYGAFLLMMPCFWGLAISSYFSKNMLWEYLLFFLGSFLMRGAGCTINDIFDSSFDKKVKRTQNRPIAIGEISKKEAYYFLLFQLFLSLLILINFNQRVIFFSLLVLPVVIIYPLLKRITFFPQIILGMIFNWGVILGCLTKNPTFHVSEIFLYLGGVFLTIGYDTIYALQDVTDDKKIGVKSLAIKIYKKPKFFISIIYLFSLAFFSVSILSLSTPNIVDIIIISIIGCHIFWQIKNINFKENDKLMKIFISNVDLGIILFIGILVKKNYVLISQLYI